MIRWFCQSWELVEPIAVRSWSKLVKGWRYMACACLAIWCQHSTCLRETFHTMLCLKGLYQAKDGHLNYTDIRVPTRLPGWNSLPFPDFMTHTYSLPILHDNLCQIFSLIKNNSKYPTFLFKCYFALFLTFLPAWISLLFPNFFTHFPTLPEFASHFPTISEP